MGCTIKLCIHVFITRSRHDRSERVERGRHSLTLSYIIIYIILHLKMPFTKKLSPSHRETTGKEKEEGGADCSQTGIKNRRRKSLRRLSVHLGHFLESDCPELQEVFCLTYCRTGHCAACGPSQAFITFGSGKKRRMAACPKGRWEGEGRRWRSLLRYFHTCVCSLLSWSEALSSQPEPPPPPLRYTGLQVQPSDTFYC